LLLAACCFYFFLKKKQVINPKHFTSLSILQNKRNNHKQNINKNNQLLYSTKKLNSYIYKSNFIVNKKTITSLANDYQPTEAQNKSRLTSGGV
jgi:hypothetical protein